MSVQEPEEFPVLEAEHIHLGSCYKAVAVYLEEEDDVDYERVPNCNFIGMWIGEVFGTATFGTPWHGIPFTILLQEELEKRGIWSGTFSVTNDNGLLSSPEDQLKHKQLLADAWNAAGLRYGFTEDVE